MQMSHCVFIVQCFYTVSGIMLFVADA